MSGLEARDRYYDIFISYSSRDRLIVHKVADRLEEKHSIWIDRNQNPGAILYREISNGLTASQIFCCFISKSYCESDICLSEIARARELRKKILPVMLAKESKNGVDVLIASLLRLNAYKPPKVFEPWSEALYEKLLCTIDTIKAASELGSAKIMTESYKNIIRTFPDYPQTLLNCALASEIIREHDPKTALTKKLSTHTIEKLIVSNTVGDGEQSTDEIKFMVCECSNQSQKKQLVVAFCATKSMNDFLLDVISERNGWKGNSHWAILRRSSRVPIEFFIRKILNEDYDIVFTGHCLAASVAALVAVRVLVHEKIQQQKKQKNVLFIGFGAPSFVDADFKEFIETDCELRNNFHFYFNENDFVIKLLHILLNILYDRKLLQTDPIRAKLLSFMEQIINLKNFKIAEFVPVVSEILRSFNQVEKTNYMLFGMLFKTNVAFEEINFFDFDYRDFIRRFENVNESVFQIHDIKNYFINIEKSYLMHRDDFNSHTSVDIYDFTELYIPNRYTELFYNEVNKYETNYFSVKFAVNALNTDIFITISCENKEFINNACLQLFGEKIELKNIVLAEESIHLVFLCPNSILEKDKGFQLFLKHREMLKSKSEEYINKVMLEELGKDFNQYSFYQEHNFNLISHFNIVYQIKFNTNYKKFVEGFSQKQAKIEQMPLDLLYMHAIFYVNAFQNVNGEFLERCDKLKHCLNRIDEIWELKHRIVKKRQEQLCERFFYFSKEWCNEFEFSDELVSLRDCIDSFNFRDHVSIVEYVFPTCYELMIQQSQKQSQTSFIRQLYADVLFSNLNLYSYTNTLKFNALYIEKPVIPYDGCYETAIVNRKDELMEQADDKNKKILRTILFNREIRNILSKNFLVGVVGKKKCGKSTFVEKITDKKTEAGANVATTRMTPYEMTDSIIIFDYPHFDSIDISHKLQFYFSRFLLDHVFLLVRAMEKMDSDDTMRLFKLVQNGSGDNFTILLNMADHIIEYSDCKCADCKCKSYKIVDDLKNEVISKQLRGLHKDKVLLTCLRTIENLEVLDGINKASILTADKVKKEVLTIISKQLPASAIFFQEHLDISKKNGTELKHKKVLIKNESGSIHGKIILTLDKQNCKSEVCYDIIDSFDDLVNEFKTGKLKNPIFKENTNEKVIGCLEEFFETQEIIFIVCDAN